MNFIAGLFLFFLASWLFFRLFGPALIRWVVRRLLRKVETEMKKQSVRYEQNHSNTPFEQPVYRNEEIKVTSKKTGKRQKPSVEEMGIDEVEYEEFK